MEPGELIDQVAAKARAKRVKAPEALKPIVPASAPEDAAGGCLVPDRHPQMECCVSIAVLHQKSGSFGSVRKFRLNVKALAQSDDLPDYRVTFDQDADAVTFYARAAKGGQAQVLDLLDVPRGSGRG